MTRANKRTPEETPIEKLGWGVAGGAIVYFLTEFWKRRVSRRERLLALSLEARGSLKTATLPYRTARDTLHHAAALVKATQGTGPYDVIKELCSGWVVYTPAIPLLESVERLDPDEAKAVIRYIDDWARLQEAEKRYSKVLADLLECLPKNGEPCGLRQQELAQQVLDNLQVVKSTAKDVRASAHEVAKFKDKL